MLYIDTFHVVYLPDINNGVRHQLIPGPGSCRGGTKLIFFTFSQNIFGKVQRRYGNSIVANSQIFQNFRENIFVTPLGGVEEESVLIFDVG